MGYSLVRDVGHASCSTLRANAGRTNASTPFFASPAMARTYPPQCRRHGLSSPIADPPSSTELSLCRVGGCAWSVCVLVPLRPVVWVHRSRASGGCGGLLAVRHPPPKSVRWYRGYSPLLRIFAHRPSVAHWLWVPQMEISTNSQTSGVRSKDQLSSV